MDARIKEQFCSSSSSKRKQAYSMYCLCRQSRYFENFIRRNKLENVVKTGTFDGNRTKRRHGTIGTSTVNRGLVIISDGSLTSRILINMSHDGHV